MPNTQVLSFCRRSTIGTDGNHLNFLSYLALPSISKATGRRGSAWERKDKKLHLNTITALFEPYSWQKLFASVLSTFWAEGQREDWWHSKFLKSLITTFLCVFCLPAARKMILFLCGENTAVALLNWLAIAAVTDSNNLQNKMWCDSRVMSLYHLNWDVCWRKTTLLRCNVSQF